MSSLYRFDEFVLDRAKRTLYRADRPVFLNPRAMDVLIFLVQNPNRLVTKDELLEAVWGDTFVEEGNLTQSISHVRKALNGSSEDTRLIVTIPRKGYQFAGDVTVSEAGDLAKPAVVQTAATDVPQNDALPIIESGRERPAPRHWHSVAALALSAIVIAVVGYMSWRYYRSAGPPPPEKIMLAVLPFKNLTGDPNKEYLADGLTEEMISELGRLNPNQLGVIARTSVMGYKYKDERLDQVGRDLSVQYVLENSLRESGNQIRLTAQLIKVKDQTHIWSQDYDYPEKDILRVEDDVSKAVAQEIRLRLTSQQQVDLTPRHRVNPEAFDAYLQGYYFFQRNTDKDTNMAASYYERSTQIDPSFALAWVGLSRTRNWQAEVNLIPKEEGRRLSHEAIERALALDPNLAAAHTQMARIKRFVDFDWAGADASVRRAIALDPGNTDTLILAAESAAISRRPEEALALAHRAVELDPLNPSSWSVLGEIEYFEGQLAGAEADVEKSLELSADAWPGPVLLSEIYLQQGRPQDALPEIKRVQSDVLRTWLNAIAYHAFGQEKRSDVALKELVVKYATSDAYHIAVAYAFRNQRDEAFKWLELAYAQHDDDVSYANLDPELENLHRDARFAAFLKKIHLPN